MWTLVTNRGQRVPLSSLPAVLGSSRDGADVTLPHSSIAERHARISEADGGLLVEALDGAAVEAGGSLVQRAQLSHGDELVLGRVSLRVVDTDAPEAAPAPLPQAAAPEQGDLGALTVRGRAPAAAPAGAARARAAAPAARSAPVVEKRRDEVLSYARHSQRRGLLHADLSQLSAPLKALLVLLFLGLAAGVTWALSALMAG